MSKRQHTDFRREELRNWTILCALIAMFEIAGVVAAHRFGAAGGAEDDPFNMPPILLVADNSDERVLYAEALEREGYVVIGADLATALARIVQDRPAAVVLDNTSWVTEGLQVLTRIHELTPALPVIVNASCPACDNTTDQTAGTYCAGSPSSEDVKRAVLAVVNHPA